MSILFYFGILFKIYFIFLVMFIICFLITMQRYKIKKHHKNLWC
nr:MAG TPA: syndecan-2 protein [Caudoviricetes sp.]